MIIAKIDVTKMDKAHFFKGAKGIYADLVLLPNRNGTDEYGNDGMVTQGVSKEAREKGQKGPIIGNYRKINRGASEPVVAPKTQPTKAKADPEIDFGSEDDVPF